jgi:hypothetical protein
VAADEIEEPQSSRRVDTIPAMRRRTPEQERRRLRFIQLVALLTGVGIAVAGFAVLRSRSSSETLEEPLPPALAEAPPAAEPQVQGAASAPLSDVPPPPLEPDLPTMAVPEGTPAAPAAPAVTPPSAAAPPAAAATPPGPSRAPSSPARDVSSTRETVAPRPTKGPSEPQPEPPRRNSSTRLSPPTGKAAFPVD